MRIDMWMQRLYCEFDAEDRNVYNIWLQRIFVLWTSVLLVMIVFCTVLALNASTTPDQRIAQ
jgi:hypothetical protein